MKGGSVADDTRLVESLPTIRKILTGGGRAILMSHLGRPNGKPDTQFTLRPVAERLSGLLGRNVKFAPECVGMEVQGIAGGLADGECLLLENLRFHAGEEANDAQFSR